MRKLSRLAGESGYNLPTADQNRDHLLRPMFNASFYRYAMLGHTQTLVDWYLIRSSVDDDLRWISRPDNLSYVYYQYALMTDLDPYFMGLYVNGANYLTVAKNDNEGALKIIEKGRRYYEREFVFLPISKIFYEWATAWRLYLTEGYLRLFEFQDFQGAMDVYRGLERFDNLPMSLQRISDRIQTPEGRIQIGLNSILSMLEAVRPDLNREKLLRFKDQLMISQFLIYWNREWRSFQSLKSPKSRSTYAAKWEYFRAQTQMPDRDPIGGMIYLNENNKIWTRSDWKPIVNEELEF